jgi:hypothetical protein
MAVLPAGTGIRGYPTSADTGIKIRPRARIRASKSTRGQLTSCNLYPQAYPLPVKIKKGPYVSAQPINQTLEPHLCFPNSMTPPHPATPSTLSFSLSHKWRRWDPASGRWQRAPPGETPHVLLPRRRLCVSPHPRANPSPRSSFFVSPDWFLIWVSGSTRSQMRRQVGEDHLRRDHDLRSPGRVQPLQGHPHFDEPPVRSCSWFLAISIRCGLNRIWCLVFLLWLACTLWCTDVAGHWILGNN